MGKNCRPYVDVMALHQEVTGSCILCIIKLPDETCKKVLIDCGLFQETNYSEQNRSFPFNAENINHVVITHNHVDHVGRLPLLVKEGYRGSIHMSYTTKKLIDKALYDSCKVIKNKAKMANEPPIYDDGDVDETLKLIKGHNYDESIWLDDNIKITLFMNGHLAGAVCILMQIRYKDSSNNPTSEDINILFTGDYNNKNLFFDVPPIPKWVHQLPVTIIQEATYGTMNSSEIKNVFEENVLGAISKGKEVIIPVFSLGRSQEIMYILKQYQESGKLSTDIPIYFDGKLGMRYTDLYLKDGLDNREEAKNFLPENFHYVPAIQPDNTEDVVTTTDIRKSLTEDGKCKIILTTSGMGSYGPAQFYLPIYIRRENALIHFTGYVAEETLGRRLFETLHGENVSISGLILKKLADVQFTTEFSAHAKADELINFLKPFEDLKLVLINHGESTVKEAYANRVVEEVDPKAVGILGRDYFFRINSLGLVKSITTKFT